MFASESFSNSMVECVNHKNVFFISASIVLSFSFTPLCDWLTKLTPLFQPIRSNPKTNLGLPARIFPRLVPVASNYLKF